MTCSTCGSVPHIPSAPDYHLYTAAVIPPRPQAQAVAGPIADGDCPTCFRGGFAPSHDGSSRCESGSIASGGSRAHCSCDVCF